MERWRSAAIWVMKATVQQLARHRIHLYKAVHIPCKAQKKWADTWSSLGTSITLKELRLPRRPRRYQSTQGRTTNQNSVAHRIGPAELQRWKKWAGAILGTTNEISRLQKIRTRKWNALNVQLWRSKMRDEVADGLTGCLYKSIFNQGEERQSLTSIIQRGRQLAAALGGLLLTAGSQLLWRALSYSGQIQLQLKKRKGRLPPDSR